MCVRVGVCSQRGAHKNAAERFLLAWIVGRVLWHCVVARSDHGGGACLRV